MTRRHVRVRTSAALAGLAVLLLLLGACGSDGPEVTPTTSTSAPLITAPTPTVDPTEEAGDAAIEAVERFYDTEEQAGLSGDWSEDVWGEVASGDALVDRLSLGADYTAAGWIFEGEISVADSKVDSVELEPTPRVTVTSCIDRSAWISPDELPDDPPRQPSLVTHAAEITGDHWLVTEISGQGDPCDP